MLIAAVLAILLGAGFHSPYCDAHRPAKSSGIRGVDFCNFTYPAPEPLAVRDDFPPDSASRFVLKNGIHAPDEEERLITLEEIQFADVTHDQRPDALVTLTWHSGGTMQLGMVYVWAMKGSSPVLLWSFIAGDRGLGGLHRAYASAGDLIVEINDPDAARGNCCSLRFIRTRYRWNGKKFVPRGKPEVLPNPDYAREED